MNQSRLVAMHGGVRRRVVDDHMLTMDSPYGECMIVRAQVFTAPGLRPVVVMTQSSRDEVSVEPVSNRTGRFCASGRGEHHV